MNFDDWRKDPAIKKHDFYVKTFAIVPTLCTDGKWIWLKTFYKKYISYSNHIDFDGNISEEEYLLRKLSEKL